VLSRRSSLRLMAAAAAGVAAPGSAAAAWPALSEGVAAEVARIAPILVTREQWRAKPALPGMKPQVPGGIIIHHTDTRQNPRISLETKMRNLQAFSQRPGQVSAKVMKPAWPDVPYHHYIEASGRIAEGRDVRFAGDTNTKYDTVGYLQVVLEGNFETETPTSEQLDALGALLTALMLSWNVPIASIGVHKQHAATTCPGRHFMAVLPQVLEHAARRRTALLADLCRRGMNADFSRLYCR
jgi:hypothetical protein